MSRPTAAAANPSPARQRVSSSGATSSASSRRSSGRPISFDGKTSGKALRRQSSGKSPFAHLPPSPAAASNASGVVSSLQADAPAIPAIPNLPGGFPHSPAGSINRGSTSASAATTPSLRTPDHSRQPRQSSASHQSSPSVVAASILRHTRDVEGVDVDIEKAAAQDEDTAAALARLDGLNSPRLTRMASGERTRKSSRNAGDAPVSASRRTSVHSERRRTPSVPASAETERLASPATSSSTAVEKAEAFGSGSAGAGAAANAETPFPAAMPWKRGSSSSASWTGGSFSQVGSLDSTSATSYATRSPASKHRRSSAGSDMSSTQSTGDGRPTLDRRTSGDGSGTTAEIPPVPPLPKDWETYRPSVVTAHPDRLGAPLSPSAQAGSPRPDGKVPFSSPHSRDAAPEPRGADSKPAVTDPTSPALPASTTPGHSRRKWSISNAFHKATRSPKTGVKESNSFGDLQSMAGKRFRHMSSSNLGESALPRRMAASTNSLSTLSSQAPSTTSPPANSPSAFNSLGRNSMKPGNFLRTRTSSYSSNATTLNGQAPQGTPAVVTTSPGKSRSSVLSSRRTPSGIPFFSRKGSSAEVLPAATPSPNLETATMVPTPLSDEKSGRKSILGLNFRRSGGSGSKRDKDKAALSPSSSARSTFSTSQSSLELSTAQVVDEFGRRASLAAPKVSAPPPAASNRKRGKVCSLLLVLLSLPQAHGGHCLQTLTSAGQNDVFRAGDHEQLPPLHIRALPPSTAERVDALAPAGKGAVSKLAPLRTRANRLQDSVKANLPTIAGSPSTSAAMQAGAKDARSELSPSASPPPKSHTPTRIPRLNRASAGVSPRSSPTLVTSKSARRLSSYGSLQSRGSAPVVAAAASRADAGGRNGVKEDSSTVHIKTARGRLESDFAASGIPRSRSTSSRISATREGEPKEASTAGPARLQGDSSATPLRTRLPNLSASTSRLPSHPTASDTSVLASTGASASGVRIAAGQAAGQDSRRTSVPPAVSTSEHLSTARSSRTLSSKSSVTARLGPTGASARPRLSPPVTESGRSSAASGIFSNEDEIRGDEEMAAYARRQRTKRLASGMDANSVRRLFEFPEPTQPLPPLSAEEARSLYSRYLSPFERHEISEYRKIYFVGPNCEKKPATKENPASNHGYDDERGDYLMVPHDHIQYRYEVIDVLGKGSFGQVLQCRDHKTGNMVAIKIIRNKKRFHHQALVEIKVLENLVRWVGPSGQRLSTNID